MSHCMLPRIQPTRIGRRGGGGGVSASVMVVKVL